MPFVNFLLPIQGFRLFKPFINQAIMKQEPVLPKLTREYYRLRDLVNNVRNEPAVCAWVGSVILNNTTLLHTYKKQRITYCRKNQINVLIKQYKNLLLTYNNLMKMEPFCCFYQSI